MSFPRQLLQIRTFLSLGVFCLFLQIFGSVGDVLRGHAMVPILMDICKVEPASLTQ